MTLLVKLCGFTSEDALRAATDAGVNAVGFVFADSVREIAPERAAELCASIPDEVLKVAVMRHPSASRWQNVVQNFRPDVVQTDAEDFAELDLLGMPDEVLRWPVYREGNAEPAICDTFVYEGRQSGRGETVDWSAASALSNGRQMILAGGLSSDNVAAAITTVRPFGVDASSGVESAPGVKDAARIKAFVNAARAAEKDL